MKFFFTKLFFLAGLLFCNLAMFATKYYVDAVNGSNSNNGLTPATAFATLIKVSYGSTPLIGGDTVFVRNGTYGTTDLVNVQSSFAVLAITTSGLPNAPIVFINYPGESPLIQFNNWHAILIQASYIEINGIRVRGNASVIDPVQATAQPSGCADPTGSPLAKFNGNGISFDPNGTNGYCHHIKVKNCTVYECCGGGLGGANCDYVTIENNRVYGNAWYSRYGNSGMSLLHLTDFDANTTTYRNIIRNNVVYDNEMRVPWYSGSCRGFTDGNGIIIDDSRNGQSGGTNVLYYGKTLIENNVVFRNGGRGIHVFVSDNVTIINNTTYANNKTAAINDGEITVMSTSGSQAGGNKVYNNVMVARTGKRLSSLNNQTSFSEDYNIMFNSGTIGYFNTHDIAANPRLTDTANNIFTLLANSPAINTGTNTSGLYTATDILGVARPQGSRPDMGAYEFTGTPTLTGAFTSGDVVGLRVGDGTTALSANASCVNLVEYTPAGAATGINITLGDATSASPNRLVTGGTGGTYEGQLSLSTDGRYLTVIGYDAATGSTPAVHQITNKVIARIGYDGQPDFSTRFATTSAGTWYNGTNVRGVISDNGSRFWVNGNSGGTGNTNAARYITFGSSTSSNPIGGSIRSFNIQNNRLYYLPNFTSAGNYTTDLPTNNPTAIAFPGSPGSANGGAGLLLFDLDATASYNGSGYDVMYIADAANGLYKFYWNAGTSLWAAAGSFNPASVTGVTGGLLSITGKKDGSGNPVLYVVKGAASNNNIIALTDASGYSGSISITPPTVTTLASAGANYMFRGVAFSPSSLVVLPVRLSSFDAHLFSTDVALNWSSSFESGVANYVVERSANGIQYAAIGAVAATNSAGGSSYRFTDRNIGEGIHYYRLKTIELDGKTSFSKVVIIRKTTAGAGLVKAFPNPVIESLSVSYPVATEKTRLIVVDMSGRELIKKTVPVGSTQTTIDVSFLSGGQYHLILSADKRIQVSKLIK